MKWAGRIIIALLLLSVMVVTAAWLAFPMYAPALLRGALHGPSHTIELNGLGRPGPGGIGFTSITATITTPPGPCSPDSPPSIYRASLGKGRIGWKLNLSSLFASALLNADLSLQSDSLAVQPESGQFVFTDRNPALSATLAVALQRGAAPTLTPTSLSYSIDDASLQSGALSAKEIHFPLLLNPQKGLTPRGGTIRIGSIQSGPDRLPVANISASFPLRADSLQPCTISLLDCSADLFGMNASLDTLTYNMKQGMAAGTLSLTDINIGELPGLKRTEGELPFATGTFQGTIPFVYRDTTVTLRNASLSAGPNTRLSYYNRENKEWLTIELNEGVFLQNLNAAASVSPDKGVGLSALSASLLGGTFSASPSRHNSATAETSLVFTLKNVNALETVHFHGDFGGKLIGSVNGTIPLALTPNGPVIRNARLRSDGGGTITIRDPQTGEASYAFSKPAAVLTRHPGGATVIDFSSQELKRTAGGGELLISHPAGRARLFFNPDNPDIITLSNFSAGFFNSTMSIARMDYDMATGNGETSIHFSSLPLQKLLDMQGTKKVYATGTLSGSIPVTMENKTFAIRDGGMNAEQNGQIIYATTPEERAAANPGLRITYDALTNFLYRDLTSTIDMEPDGQSEIALHLKGRNPDYQNGRPIEINLTIRQNLLDLMRSLSISSSIEQVISEKALQQRTQ
ncbi:hypothetical protein EKD02_01125 [Chlorobium phaeovibrioides]|uniref:Dicarboxylate transport domain-containing protein n=1 Tax=Chlorobium phaeovibrioides TaxID=1094 RepID=A0A3S0NKJ2_CHLPH|nr:YdbH domain-containing protein [Chlorobium phaeovibrioides]RTY40028.1 hypothetical protein EKD02_01125 [Chlorobium phaeovibrioides]